MPRPPNAPTTRPKTARTSFATASPSTSFPGTREVKETPKELVRQRIARALFHEYGISVEDMAADCPVRIGGRRRRVDIAIFAAGESHTLENIQRVVVCRPEPKQNKRGAVKMRDYDQAAQDIADVKPSSRRSTPASTRCGPTVWSSSFSGRRRPSFQVDAEPIGDWPPVDESIDDPQRAVTGPRTPRRPGDAAHRVSPLPQLHPRQ